MIRIYDKENCQVGVLHSELLRAEPYEIGGVLASLIKVLHRRGVINHDELQEIVVDVIEPLHYAQLDTEKK